MEICEKNKKSTELIILNEEKSKDYSIVYAKFNGAEGYLTLFLDKEFRGFSNKKIYVKINNKDVKIFD